ncbi:hypothetical protein [Evansella tamaricis]|uniref:hypothetical protein n=1 Tax=Evansella tamaricis TaxID=2069301 RepID=UPI0031B7FD35
MDTTEKHPFIRFLGVICYVTAILYLTEAFFPNATLMIIYSLLGGFLLLCTFPFLPKISRIIVLMLVLFGITCFYLEEIPIQEAVLGFGRNTNLLSLFLLIPLIGTFMTTAGYLESLKRFVQSWENKGGHHPYLISFILTATTGIILNFGSMAIVKKIADQSFTSFREQLLTLTIMRAFGFCMLWSPYFVNVGLVLVVFDLTWVDIGKYGMVLAGVYLILSLLMYKYIAFPDDPIIHMDKKEEGKIQRTSLVPLLRFSIVLIVSSFSIDYMLEVNMLTVVSVVAIVLPFIWALFSKILKSFFQDVLIQVQSSFFSLKNELAIFISAGFFGMAISQTNIGPIMSEFLFRTSLGSVYALTILLVLLTTGLAQIGIHPVIIVIGIGSALSPDKFGVSPEYLAVALLVAWTISTTISPFSGQILMASKLMNRQPSVIIRQNVFFIIIVAAVLTFTLYSFYLFGFI